MNDVYDLLNSKGIVYERYEHPAVFTVEEAHIHRPDTDFWENKNLFLRNKKGDKQYLVTLGAEKQLNLKALGEKLGERLSFASTERLEEYLHLTPGSVSPFGLIHESARAVVFILDSDALQHEKIGVHPNTNTETIVMDTKEFIRVIESIDNPVQVQDL